MEIIEVFENGKPSTYGKIVTIKGDTGGLSGGLFMASLTSGNLGKLLRLYRQKGGTLISEEEVQQTEAKDASQNYDPVIKTQFKAAASDPLMIEAQDEFFASRFLAPAKTICAERGFTEPLILALVTDGLVHGSYKLIDSKVPKTVNQWDYARIYTQTRKDWLANHSNPVLHTCVYRMLTFEALIAANNWGLNKPFTVHGVTLT
jgi:chitosanase